MDLSSEADRQKTTTAKEIDFSYLNEILRCPSDAFNATLTGHFCCVDFEQTRQFRGQGTLAEGVFQRCIS